MFVRSLIFLLGLSILSLGIATVTHAGLGTSTISSIALVLSMKIPLTMGFFVFLTNVFFFVLQIAVDPTRIWVKFIKQIPICFIFGMFFDVAYALTSFVTPDTYVTRALTVLMGTCFTGLGVSGMVFSRLAILPPEGFVLAIMKRWGGSFGNLRTWLDVFLVIVAVIASWLLLGRIEGVREGTFIAAICAGQFAKLFLHLFGKFFPAHRAID